MKDFPRSRGLWEAVSPHRETQRAPPATQKRRSLSQGTGKQLRLPSQTPQAPGVELGCGGEGSGRQNRLKVPLNSAGWDSSHCLSAVSRACWTSHCSNVGKDTQGCVRSVLTKRHVIYWTLSVSEMFQCINYYKSLHSRGLRKMDDSCICIFNKILELLTWLIY